MNQIKFNCFQNCGLFFSDKIILCDITDMTNDDVISYLDNGYNHEWYEENELVIQNYVQIIKIQYEHNWNVTRCSNIMKIKYEINPMFDDKNNCSWFFSKYELKIYDNNHYIIYNTNNEIICEIKTNFTPGDDSTSVYMLTDNNILIYNRGDNESVIHITFEK